MLSGRRFRLELETLALRIDGSKRVVLRIPAGSVVQVLARAHLDDRRLIDIRWNDLTLVAFVEDLERRGSEVKAGSV